jgi:hypothetical protein
MFKNYYRNHRNFHYHTFDTQIEGVIRNVWRGNENKQKLTYDRYLSTLFLSITCIDLYQVTHNIIFV